jgi:hypothetical protein
MTAADKQREYNRKYDAANREKRRQAARARYANSEDTRRKVAAYNKQYLETNRARLKKKKLEWYAINREHALVYAAKYNAVNGTKMMLRNAKRRAEKAGVPCTLALTDIVIPPTCPVFGVPFSKGKFSASLDRIEPKLGYVPGNIIVISRHANVIKTNATWEEIIRVGEFYRKLVNS